MNLESESGESTRTDLPDPDLGWMEIPKPSWAIGGGRYTDQRGRLYTNKGPGGVPDPKGRVRPVTIYKKKGGR